MTRRLTYEYITIGGNHRRCVLQSLEGIHALEEVDVILCFGKIEFKQNKFSILRAHQGLNEENHSGVKYILDIRFCCVVRLNIVVS